MAGRFRSVSKLLRVTAYVFKAVKLFKKTPPPSNSDNSSLTAEDLANAEKLWVVQAQQKLVQEEKLPLWKKQFDLFVD